MKSSKAMSTNLVVSLRNSGTFITTAAPLMSLPEVVPVPVPVPVPVLAEGVGVVLTLVPLLIDALSFAFT